MIDLYIQDQSADVTELNVWDEYEVGTSTKALEFHHHPVYQTKIYDVDGEFFSSKSMLDLIKIGCLEGGADYEGRKKAVKHCLGIQRKIPIVMDYQRRICIFPTKSPEEYDCMWIFTDHVKSYYGISNSRVKVIFWDGSSLIVPISERTFQTQMGRTSQCFMRFSSDRNH
ncbi:competence protein ComK [Bacillus timonensis]|nr:competence protein ComK [Bacillus timonensis]